MSIRRITDLNKINLTDCIIDNGSGLSLSAAESFAEMSWSKNDKNSTFESKCIKLKDLTDVIVHQVKDLDCTFNKNKVLNNSLSVLQSFTVGELSGNLSLFPTNINASSISMRTKEFLTTTNTLSSIMENGFELIHKSKTTKSFDLNGGIENNISPLGETHTLSGETKVLINLDSLANIEIRKKGYGTILSSNNFGNFVFDKDIIGTALHAKWSDLAEIYISDKDYLPGTLVKFGGEHEITLADTDANAVISTKPGILINYTKDVIKDKIRLPIALVGRVLVRVVGKISKFDKICLSETNGVATLMERGEDSKIIGVALESSDVQSEKLVLCSVKLTF